VALGEHRDGVSAPGGAIESHDRGTVGQLEPAIRANPDRLHLAIESTRFITRADVQAECATECSVVATSIRIEEIPGRSVRPNDEQAATPCIAQERAVARELRQRRG
jgi:hypothetical protein